MDSHYLKLGQVYSRLATPEDLARLTALGADLSRLPTDRPLRRHQALTWIAFLEGYDVIFDSYGQTVDGLLPGNTRKRAWYPAG